MNTQPSIAAPCRLTRPAIDISSLQRLHEVRSFLRASFSFQPPSSFSSIYLWLHFMPAAVYAAFELSSVFCQQRCAFQLRVFTASCAFHISFSWFRAYRLRCISDSLSHEARQRQRYFRQALRWVFVAFQRQLAFGVGFQAMPAGW